MAGASGFGVQRMAGVLLASIALLGASVAPTASADRWYDWPGMRKCRGTIQDGYTYKVYVDRTRCQTGKRLLRRFLSGRGVSNSEPYRIKGWKGWLCGEGAGGGACTKGPLDAPRTKTVGWQVK